MKKLMVLIITIFVCSQSLKAAQESKTHNFHVLVDLNQLKELHKHKGSLPKLKITGLSGKLEEGGRNLLNDILDALMGLQLDSLRARGVTSEELVKALSPR